MNYVDICKLFAVGYACGHILSVIPAVTGMLISFAINLMKGGS